MDFHLPDVEKQIATSKYARPQSRLINHLPFSWALLMLIVPGMGCRLARTAAEIPGQTVRAVTPGQKSKEPTDPVEVQQRLLRFADQYSTRMVLGVDKLRRGTNELEPAEILKWKVALATETCSIASGPNAIANLLDMTIFVTVMRMALEEDWQPKAFGQSALPMLESSRNAEAEIWQLAGTVLTSDHQKELRQAIDSWRIQNPLPESALAARSLGFTSELVEAVKVDETTPGSVFTLLRVDPLAGMDPAVRELAQTRLLAERALYVAQQMPMVLRWQTELLAVNTVQMPAVRHIVTNSTLIAAAVERFAHVAELLPGQISSEREEILKALESHEKQLAPLVNEVQEMLTAGTQMSTSLNTTLTTFDALMKRFGVGETNGASPPQTNSEPFRIQDYAKTAAQLEATARQLTELLVTLDKTIGSTNLSQLSAQMGPVIDQAQTGGKRIVDYGFWKGLLLVSIGLAAALIYKFLVARLMSGPKSGPNAP